MRWTVLHIQWGVCAIERLYRGDEAAQPAGLNTRTRHSRPLSGGALESVYQRYVGIDWATQSHRVCVITPDRKLVGERSVEHGGIAIGEFIDWLTEQVDDPASVAVAIETPRGALVEALIERGFHVYAINPKQLDRFRDRHTVAGAKDDRRDAFVLADSVRTDRACFRLVNIEDAVTVELREVARIDDDLREELSRLSNRLREQLHRSHPNLLQLCPNAGDPWFWELVERVCKPDRLVALFAGQVDEILKSYRIRKVTSAEIMEVLKAPSVRVSKGTMEAARTHIALLLPRLRLVHQQRKECSQRLDALLAGLPHEDSSGQKVEHRDVDILRSLPGAGRVVSATVFAEASLPLKERDYHAFRALSGIAPVTKQTGKQGQPGSGRKVCVQMRYACNRRLRNAMYHWARVSAQKDDATRNHYAALRKRGHSHGRALRGTADRLLRILFAMLRTNTLYEPNFCLLAAA